MSKKRSNKTTASKNKPFHGGLAAQLSDVISSRQTTKPIHTQAPSLQSASQLSAQEKEDRAEWALWEREMAEVTPLEERPRATHPHSPTADEPSDAQAEEERLALTQALEQARQKATALQRQLDVLQQKVHQERLHWSTLQEQQQAKQATLEERCERFLCERNQAKEALAKLHLAQQEATPLTTWLTERHIPAAMWPKTMRQIFSLYSEQILPLLRADEALGSWLEQRLSVVCQHPECVESLQTTSRLLIEVEDAALCDHCKGSDNRRAFLRMAQVCRSHRKYRLIIVGGNPDTRAEIQRLAPAGLIHRLVSGKERRTKQQANDDLRYADLIVIWGPTILSHRVSELYTKQRDAYPDKIVLVQRRGIASLAREVCIFLANTAEHPSTTP